MIVGSWQFHMESLLHWCMHRLILSCFSITVYERTNGKKKRKRKRQFLKGQNKVEENTNMNGLLQGGHQPIEGWPLPRGLSKFKTIG